MKKEIKLKKRGWIFRWLRKKLGINQLALLVYENQGQIRKIRDIKKLK